MATALVAASVASGCAAVGGPIPVIGIATVPGTQDPAQMAGSAPWSPKGAAPVRLISSAGGGETVAVKLGDRIGFPASEPGGLGGYRVTGDGEALIRYGGSMTTWLANAPGTAKILITRYDRTRPCIPPQPIGEFTIRVAGDGIRSAIPAPVDLPAGSAVTVHLVPGQQCG